MSGPGTNTSASGGPMLPDATPAPLEGTALLDAIQETLVALTGIDSKYVRPRFQTEPPDVPDNSAGCWVAFGIEDRPADAFPYLNHNPTTPPNEGQDEFQRQEELVVLCSFYDNGSVGTAYGKAALLRDGLSIPQNMEALKANNIVLGYTGQLTPLPSLLKTVWLYRVDLAIHFRRQVDRVFRTQTLLTAEIDLKANTPGSKILERVIDVTPNTVIP